MVYIRNQHLSSSAASGIEGYESRNPGTGWENECTKLGTCDLSMTVRLQPMKHGHLSREASARWDAIRLSSIAALILLGPCGHRCYGSGWGGLHTQRNKRRRSCVHDLASTTTPLRLEIQGCGHKSHAQFSRRPRTGTAKPEPGSGTGSAVL